MSTIRFLLDENVDPDLRKALNSQWPDIEVWVMGDPGAPSLQTRDPDILLWCEAHNFTLITKNRKSIPGHLKDHLAAGRHVPGIFTLRGKMTIGQMATMLALIWGASEPDEYVDRLIYLRATS